MPGFERIGLEIVAEGIDKYLSDMGRYDSATAQSVRATQDAEKATKEAAKAAAEQRKAWRDLASAAGDLGGKLLAFGGVLTGISTGLAMAAGRYEELGLAMNVTGANADISESQLAEYEQALQKTGISASGARELLLRLMQSEIDLAQATDLARAAQDLAVVGMTDSTETANDFAYAISSLNVRILRKYGIVGNMSSILEKYGESMGLAGDELKAFTNEADDATQRQAMLSFILSEAGKFTGVYEEAMGSASKQIRSFKRYISDLAVDLGNILLPAFTKIVFAVKDVIQAFMDLPEPIKQIIVIGGAATGVLTTLGGGFLLLAGQVIKFAGTIGTLGTALASLGTAMGEAGTIMGGLMALLGSPAVLVVLGVVAALGALAVAYIAAHKEAERLEKEAGRLNEKFGEQMDILNSLAPDKYVDSLKATDVALLEATRTQKNLNEERQRNVDARIAEIEATEDLTEAERESMIAIQESLFGVTESTQAFSDHAEAVVDTVTTLEGMARQAQMIDFRTKDMALSMYYASGAAERLTWTTAGIAAGIQSALSAEEMLKSGMDMATIVNELYGQSLAEAGAEGLTAAQSILVYRNAIIEAQNAAAAAAAAQQMAIFNTGNLITELTGDMVQEIKAVGGAGIDVMDRVAKKQAEIEQARSDAARFAAQDVQWWYEDQNEFIADNAAKLTEELQQEFAARTEAARAEADQIKEYNADLAMDLLQAESDYQKQKAAIVMDERMSDEEKQWRLSILERENNERIERTKARAELEAQIEQEKFDREVENMRAAGAAGGAAMADSFAERFSEVQGHIRQLYDYTSGLAEEGVKLPEGQVAGLLEWLNFAQGEIQKAGLPEEMEQSLEWMLREIYKYLYEQQDIAMGSADEVSRAWLLAANETGGAWAQNTEEVLTALENLTGTEWTLDIGGNIVEVQTAIAETQFAMDSLVAQPYDVQINYHGEPPDWYQFDSPRTRMEHALESLVDFAANNPVVITYETVGEGPPGLFPGGGPGRGEEPPGLLTGLDVFGLGGKLASAGSYFARLYEQKYIDPIQSALNELDKREEEIQKARDKALKENLNDWYQAGQYQVELLRIEQERVRLNEELAQKQKLITEFQEKQQQFEFLRQQMDLLKTVREYGLDPAQIFEGFTFGLDANLEGLVSVITRMMDEMVRAANRELGISSPSKKFLAMGENIMLALAQGAAQASAVPAAVTQVAAARTVASAGAVLGPAGPNVSVTVGPNTINNGMDQAYFEQRVLKVVGDAVSPY